MADTKLALRVEILEARLAKLAAAFIVLLEAIDSDSEKRTAREIWEAMQADLEPPR